MIPWLLDVWETDNFLRLFDYITVRAAVGLVLAFIASMILGPVMIRALRRLKMGQPILTITHRKGAQDLSEMHGAKAGTPTMGGLLILISLLIPVLLLCDLRAPSVWALLVLTAGLALLGGWDDYLKIAKRHNRGLRGYQKIMAQVVIGLVFGLILLSMPTDSQPQYQRALLPDEVAAWEGTHGEDLIVMGEIIPPQRPSEDHVWVAVQGYGHVMVPFFKNVYPGLGLLFLLWVILVITAASNSVNLTDGLDGLAIGLTMMVAICFGVIAYVVARPGLARYLLIPMVPEAGEVAVFLGCMIGASFGFLWFNAHPAEVFMGDIGSLTLGGLLGGVALLLKVELLLVIVGGLFVVEALSVILQIGSYKMRGKRLFLMAPIHHHFEKLGWHESKIIARFWIIGALLVLFGLATMKMR